MNYKFLIEKEKDRKTFDEKVRPHLKANDTYFKAYLMSEDGERYDACIGFGFNCRMCDFEKDVEKWIEEEVDYGYAKIYTKKLLEDGTAIAVAHKYI